MKLNEEILVSDGVSEILSQPPNWLARSGIYLITFIVGFLILLSWLISYPEIIVSEITVISKNPAIRLFSRSTGFLDLRVRDAESVSAGQILGVIKNSANIEQVERLHLYVDELSESVHNISRHRDPLEGDQLYSLGSLQNAFNSYLSYLNERDLILKQIKEGSDSNRNSRIKEVQAQKIGIENQLEIDRVELEIRSEEFKEDSTLYTNSMGTKSQMNNSKIQYLQIKRKIEILQGQLKQTELEIRRLEFDSKRIKESKHDQLQKVEFSLINSFRELQSKLEIWSMDYLIKSPIEGRVSMSSYLADNLYIQNGNQILTIVPESNEILGNVEIPSFGAGKVKEGQKAKIKIHNYPYAEFGVVEGQILSISAVPRENRYFALVGFPNQLKTSFGLDLEFKQEMKGTAEIIAEDRLLIDHVFRNLKSIF